MSGPPSNPGLKRKRSKHAENVSKRIRIDDEDHEDHDEPTARILMLENGILESRRNYNNISTLLELARHSDRMDASLAALISLCRIFVRLSAAKALTREAGQSEKEVVVTQWLRGRLGETKEVLLAALAQDDSASTALTLVMRLLQAEGLHPNTQQDYNFPKAFLKDVLYVLLHSKNQNVRQEYCEKFFGEYRDVQFYTFLAVRDIVADLDGAADELIWENVFELLAFFEGVPKSAEDLGQYYAEVPKKKNHPVASASQHRRQGQEAWLALIGLVRSREQRKRILQKMTRSIAPWFTKPELLADFLTDSYNAGGSMSLLALSGVFYLIQHRNLDYPSFYRKLYSLLNADILHSKHRSKFFRLLDTFLGSSHLPATLVASFIKKLGRLCLNSPPAAIVAMVPWMYNLFKKHPTCTFMLHRIPRTQEQLAHIEAEGFSDPFVAHEQDPMETRAIDSCLWEVDQLRSHYHPNVATIAKIISEQFTKYAYNLEDFLDHSYTSFSEAEVIKQIRKPPVVEFMVSKGILLPSAPVSENNLLTKIWGFE